MAALADALARHTGLFTLHLCSNSIGGEGMVALVKALTRHTQLHTLDLRSNAILDPGAQTLARLLRANGSINRLDIRDNGIGDEGALALAAALASAPCRTVPQRYSLRGPRLTATGAAAVGHRLRSNPACSHTFAIVGDRGLLVMDMKSAAAARTA
jgi:Ran GTPase-activating protein (RanGAP) involved in mRNA processing and transport